jgi:hypothetical protein
LPQQKAEAWASAVALNRMTSLEGCLCLLKSSSDPKKRNWPIFDLFKPFITSLFNFMAVVLVKLVSIVIGWRTLKGQFYQNDIYDPIYSTTLMKYPA